VTVLGRAEKWHKGFANANFRALGKIIAIVNWRASSGPFDSCAFLFAAIAIEFRRDQFIATPRPPRHC
jgi:hypothetical protein